MICFAESRPFIHAVIALILINAVTLGLETDKQIFALYGPTLLLVDQIILVFFTIEIALKLVAYRAGFFRSGWNLFDLFIVAIAWVPASGSLALLRSLRILRVLRLLSVSPQLRRVISAVGQSIPGMMSVISVLAIIFYISSVLATKLFGDHPSPEMQEWFGSIGASAYTLFQVMTLESWSMGIVRPTMELYPYAWAFFVPFIFVTSFAVLNLFIGIIVDAMQSGNEAPLAQGREELKDFTHTEIEALHKRFDALEARLAEALAQREGGVAEATLGSKRPHTKITKDD
ncbi:MAG: ion transporter [Pseudomonadota bacterium]